MRTVPTGVRALVRYAMIGVLAVTVGGCASAPEKPIDRAVLDLLGPDDGSHIVIFYGSEIMGSLDGCGCMGNPKLGGFPYRVAVTRAFAESNPNVGVLQVDAGFASSPITNQTGTVSSEAREALRTTYEALAEAGFAAVNVTAQDMPVASAYFAVDAEPAAFSGVLTSANLEPISPSLWGPVGVVMKRVSRPGGRGSVNVAIIGVSEFPGRLSPASGFRVTDPRPALERQIGGSRSQADVVVVLASMPAAAALALLAELGQKPDVLIVANSFGAGSADGSVMGSGLEPRLDGPTRVVYSWYKTQKLGVLRLKLDENNRVTSATNAYVKLDVPIVPDEAAEAMVVRQKNAVRAAKEARYRAEGVQGTNAGP